MLNSCVPLLYCKGTVEKINSFGKIIEFYVACSIIFIKWNKVETIDGLLDKFVIGDVIFIYLIDIVIVDHCTDTVGIIFSCTPSIRVTVLLISAKNSKASC